jgi:hypothetical protein
MLVYIARVVQELQPITIVINIQSLSNEDSIVSLSKPFTTRLCIGPGVTTEHAGSYLNSWQLWVCG